MNGTRPHGEWKGICFRRADPYENSIIVVNQERE